MSKDLDNLCNELDGRIEDRTFELKREPPTVDEVVKEIQGGMNGLERCYRIIVGIDEGKDKKFSRTNITPVVWQSGKGALASADTYRTAIDSALKSSTSDYHEGYWRFNVIPIVGGDVVVIEALKSPYAPHQNTQTGRYYIRRAGNTSHMTAMEIRQAMHGHSEEDSNADAPREPVAEDELIADLQDHDWVPDANELRYVGGPQLHVRVFPVDLQEGRFSGTYLKNNVKGLFSLGPWQNGSSERVEDGFVAWRVEHSNHEKTGAFSKVFETGEIWGVDNKMLAPSEDKFANIPGVIIQKVREAILQYGNVLDQSLHVKSPYRVQITLHGVKGGRFHISPRGGDGRCLRDTLVYNALWDIKDDPSADELCNNWAKELWDACGLTLINKIQF